jgi:hypothetical protein
MKLLRNIFLATLVLAVLLPLLQGLIAQVATSALAACGSKDCLVDHPAVFRTTRIDDAPPVLILRDDAVLILREDGTRVRRISPRSHGSVAPPTPVRTPVVVLSPV